MKKSSNDLKAKECLGAKLVREALKELEAWKKTHHGKMSAEEVLLQLIDILMTNLYELKDAKSTDPDRFAYGEKTAYVEVLEIIQDWKDAIIHGLDFVVEKVFPL